MPPPTLAQRLALIADQIRDQSALGLYFARDIYERERCETLQTLSVELLALATAEPLTHFEPLRAPVIARPTPFVGGDAAVVDDTGRILLIQRADNHKWAMPGGALEAGETPAAGVEREALEETGVQCKARAFVGVFDSRLSQSPTRHHLYHLVFLCEPLDTSALGQGSHRHEVLEVRWFEANALPEELDPGHALRVSHALRRWRGEGEAYFD